MIKRKGAVLCLLLAVILVLAGCGKSGEKQAEGNRENSMLNVSYSAEANVNEMDFSFSSRDLSGDYDTNQVNVTLKSGGADISGQGAVFEKNALEITKEGTYFLSGETGAMIRISVADTEKVQLVLKGVTIKNSNGPAIYIKSGDKVFITLFKDSVNTLSDGADYTLSDDDMNIDATIFSRADLTLNGEGTLNINGNAKHAVVSKDDLVISGGTHNIAAKNIGMNGKDCVKICDANIKIEAGSDGIRSDNTEDATRGFIYIESGNIGIESGNDGLQAQTLLSVKGGMVNLSCGGGSENASTNKDGGFNDAWGFGGYDNNFSASNDTKSAKGLKSAAELYVSGGEITVNSADDCIHSNGNVEISGGTMALTSGDDGVHADTSLKISDGIIEVTKSYEGLESGDITVSGGKISVTASDDGLNAAGGNDGSSFGRPGQGAFSASSGTITISGGYLLVNALGDGIDSNGTIEISGGVTLVSGPTNNGNGAFDYQFSAKVTGGTLIALGTQGMAQGFSSAENQGTILISTSTQSGGTNLLVADENDKVLASFTPAKAYQSAVITAGGIEKGKTYKIIAGASVQNADQNGYGKNTTYSGGTVVAAIEMTSLIYGSSGGTGGFGGGHGGMGGGMQHGGRW